MKELVEKAIDIAIKNKDMIVVNYFDSLKEVLLLMGQYHFSYLPIVDTNMNVLGIVSSDAIIDIFNKRIELNVNEDDKLNKYTNFFNLSNKTNGMVLFFKQDVDIYELHEYVDGYQHTTHKCNLILLTSTGDKNGRLVGLLTPWDLLKNS